MEREEACEGEECGTLKLRSRKVKIGNSAPKGAAVVMVEEEEESGGELERCVYLDRDQGKVARLWKCRHCIWTYRMGSPCIDLVHNHEECSNGVMSAKTSSLQGLRFGLQIKGSESTHEITEAKSDGDGLFNGEKELGNDEMDFEQKNLENQNVGNYRNPKHAKAESQSSSLLTISEGQHENGSAEFDPVKDINGSLVNANKMAVEMDIEKVLEEQDTHDLYCPNCNSCITKRVILRKRKRTPRDPQVDTRREKTQPLLRPDMEAGPDTTVATDPSHETEPDVFRCLSCFSFFIPMASGFKLFRSYGRNNEGENLQSPTQAPVKNLNCVSSIFELFSGKRTGNEPGKDTVHSDKEEITQPFIQSQQLDESEALLHQSAGTTSMKGVHLPDKLSFVGEHIDDATRNNSQAKQSSLVLLMPGTMLPQETQVGNGEERGNEFEQHNSGNSTTQDTQRDKAPENLHVNGGKQMGKDMEHIPLKDEVNAPILSKPELLMIGAAQLGIGENFICEPKEHVAGITAGNKGAHIGSNKVDSTNSLPYPDRTLSDENNTISLFPNSQLHQNIKISVGNEVKDPENKPLEDVKNIVISTNPEAFLHANAQVDFGENLAEAPKRVVGGSEKMQGDQKNELSLLAPSPHPWEICTDERNGTVSTNQNGHLLEESHVTAGKLMDNPEKRPLKNDNTNLILLKPVALVSGERKFDTGEILEEAPNNNLPDTVKPEMLVSSQSKEKVPAMAAPGPLLETRIDIGKQRVDGAITHEWHILKSIVYGGLIESILSLGLVLSAAGSDATTLKIVALGVANLVSGLFVIVHNLRELKNDPHSSMDQGGKLDRYHATLGRRENFRMHATVAVLSYIIFGLLPPVIYCFSFRKSDNKEYKLIAVAAASLICITLLATGKAHVREGSKRYMKTVLYYASIGVAASGLSFVAGELLKNLLDKFGWLDSSAAALMPSNFGFLEMENWKSGWASY